MCYLIPYQSHDELFKCAEILKYVRLYTQLLTYKCPLMQVYVGLYFETKLYPMLKLYSETILSYILKYKVKL